MCWFDDRGESIFIIIYICYIYYWVFGVFMDNIDYVIDGNMVN